MECEGFQVPLNVEVEVLLSPLCALQLIRRAFDEAGPGGRFKLRGGHKLKRQ